MKSCVFLSFGEEHFNKEKELIDVLLKNFKNIKTIVKNINKKNTNVILGEKNIILYGNGSIKDKLRRLFF